MNSQTIEETSSHAIWLKW